MVDDGSTDGSREVIDHYRHRVVTVEQANGGQAAALNAGFAACKADLVIFLDADDELRPQAAERVVQHFRPGVAKLHFRLDAVDKDGAPLGFTNPPESQPLAAGSEAPSILSKGRYTTPVMSGNVFVRDVLERILPMPADEWRISADGYLVTAAPFHGTVVPIEERLGAYRLHGANAWAPDTVDDANLPRRVEHDLAKYALVEALAAANDLPAPRHLELRDHIHLRNRIASLRLNPQSHPVGDDRRWRLAWWGMVQGPKLPANPFAPAPASRNCLTWWSWTSDSLGVGPVGPRLRRPSAPSACQRWYQRRTLWREAPSWRATSAWRTPAANSSAAHSRRAGAAGVLVVPRRGEQPIASACGPAVLSTQVLRLPPILRRELLV